MAVAGAKKSRKLVTVLFADLAGSTALQESLDAESVRAVMARFYEAMRAVIAEHEGSLQKFIGDAVVALFGMPVVREEGVERFKRFSREVIEVEVGAVTALRDGLWASTDYYEPEDRQALLARYVELGGTWPAAARRTLTGAQSRAPGDGRSAERPGEC